MPISSLNKFPHEFSGGQRQRIGIAKALALNPDFLVLDEPISALDVSIQAQIINLLKDLQKDLNLTLLLISHDLAVVKYISTKIAVMQNGKIVETALTENLFENPSHPYTKKLLSSAMELEFNSYLESNRLSKESILLEKLSKRKILN
jgi:ABC-type oligopeptide transport system ATPase subunit